MSYFGISTEELRALGSVSGEACRLYFAVSSFAYGSKIVCHPMWYQLAEVMGKPITIDHEKIYKSGKNKGSFVPESEQRKAQKRPLMKLAQQLEAEGLLTRGTFGKRDRWELILKKKLIEAKRKNSKEKEEYKNDPMVVDIVLPIGDHKVPHGSQNTTPLNIKINKKRKQYHVEKKQSLNSDIEENLNSNNNIYIYNNTNNRTDLYQSFFRLISNIENFNTDIKVKLKVKSLLTYFTSAEWYIFDVEKENYENINSDIIEYISKFRE